MYNGIMQRVYRGAIASDLARIGVFMTSECVLEVVVGRFGVVGEEGFEGSGDGEVWIVYIDEIVLEINVCCLKRFVSQLQLFCSIDLCGRKRL